MAMGQKPTSGTFFGVDYPTVVFFKPFPGPSPGLFGASNGAHGLLLPLVVLKSQGKSLVGCSTPKHQERNDDRFLE